MNTNKTAILISISAIIVFGLAACLGHSNAAIFDSCVLLLTCALGTLFYSVMRRVYQW
jgi:hypothetical protein